MKKAAEYNNPSSHVGVASSQASQSRWVKIPNQEKEWVKMSMTASELADVASLEHRLVLTDFSFNSAEKKVSCMP